MSWEDNGGTRRVEKAEVRWNTPSHEAVEHERNSSWKIPGKLLTEPQFPHLCHELNIYFVALKGLIREPGTWHTQYMSATFSCSFPSLPREDPGSTLAISTRELDVLQVSGRKPVCARGGPRCLRFPLKVLSGRDGAELV